MKGDRYQIMEQFNRLRKNPSRETCEGIIKRILTTEVKQHGSNTHFKGASDFMNYFESLYPASDALTKQVQRAIKAMNMPRDESGYLIVDKSVEQYEQESLISNLFLREKLKVDPMEDIETVFVAAPPYLHAYLIQLFESTVSFQGKFLTIAPVSNGLLFYTARKEALLNSLNSLTI
jgi:hypothetical protein